MSRRQIVHGLPWLLLTALPLPALAASNAGSLLKQIESQSAPLQSAPGLKTPTVPSPSAAPAHSVHDRCAALARPAASPTSGRPLGFAVERDVRRRGQHVLS